MPNTTWELSLDTVRKPYRRLDVSGTLDVQGDRVTSAQRVSASTVTSAGRVSTSTIHSREGE